MMRRRCDLAIAALILALAALAPGLAGAKPKKVVPQAGTYGAPAGSKPAGGAAVKKKGGKATVSFTFPVTYQCDDGFAVPLEFGFEAPIKGVKFSTTGTTDDAVLGEYTFKVKGEFTSATALKGTYSVEGEGTVAGTSTHCASGTVAFKMVRTS